MELKKIYTKIKQQQQEQHNNQNMKNKMNIKPSIEVSIYQNKFEWFANRIQIKRLISVRVLYSYYQQNENHEKQKNLINNSNGHLSGALDSTVNHHHHHRAAM